MTGPGGGTIKTGDVVSGAVLAGVGVFIIVEARGWDYLGPDGPGPGFFPLWYGVCMVALALLLVVTSVVQRASAPAKPVDWGEVGRALVAWTGLALCVGFLKILGFLLAFGLFSFFLVAVMYRRPLGTSLAVSVGMAAGFYVLFPLALNVALPVGKLGF
ncbi:MAG TPA: tripartite tricarboxylate transporter TctB family protein [Burkholderiales bacterium]|nr:tripartite tricarboxylate transporter TctB family protein [Burkholderiales bacterium]